MARPERVPMPSEAVLEAGAPRTSLSRILGLGFGLAVIFGGTVGVGILRLPGTIAAQMGSFWPIMLVWIAGGVYAMLGAVSISELGTAMPQAGGFYVYSRRAFGPAVGFAVGWADWLCNCAGIAYAAVAAAEYAGALTSSLSSHPTAGGAGTAVALFSPAMDWPTAEQFDPADHEFGDRANVSPACRGVSAASGTDECCAPASWHCARRIFCHAGADRRRAARDHCRVRRLV